VGERTEDFVHAVPLPTKSLAWKLRHRLDWDGWPQKSFAASLTREVRRLHETQGIELLEIEESYGWARFLAGKVPVPIVVRLHGPWFLNGAANGATQDQAFRRRHIWEMDGLLAADAITAPSADVLSRTVEQLTRRGPAPILTAAIANPVEPVPAPDRWNLKDCDRNRIVFVGRFDRHKGGDLMIDAFAHLLRRRPDARLDFVGPDRGCVADDGKTWELNDYLRSRLNDEDRATVTVHGFKPAAEAAKLRKQALVTVAPSRYESFSLAASEAMMAGCPLVVAGAGALNDLVQHGRNGLVASAGDSHDLAEKILALLQDPMEAARLGNQAAIDAADRYAPDVIASQMLDFYGRVLKSSRGRLTECYSAPASAKPASVSA
jgi:glycosyltransferase involved in cell wall biosynthesis